ncbi:MAG: hypothetical protein D4R65_01470 [Verrucomicrobiaceae bacterium]|nr:MAG: hypothetical protein D4R65_01470 [Verrucomicrobiaceae bacterium]
MKSPRLVILFALTAGMTLHADPVIQEYFEYGPGVPERDAIKADDSVKQSGISAAGNAWQVAGFSGMVFAPGKGIAIKGGNGNVSLFIEVDPNLFAQGSAVRAELEFVPGDVWVDAMGVPGIWLGFANSESGKKELLANIGEAGDHLVLRYAVAPDPVKWSVVVKTGVSGETTMVPGPKIPFQPGATYRMTLLYKPADHSYEATILDMESGTTETVRGTLSLPPVFNILRVDFTGLNMAPSTAQPMIKSISLEKE